MAQAIVAFFSVLGIVVLISVILSLSKDQLPEGVHLYGSVCAYWGLILVAQDDGFVKEDFTEISKCTTTIFPLEKYLLSK
jgi:hypothetical protein